jgi:hypothetical protein
LEAYLTVIASFFLPEVTHASTITSCCSILFAWAQTTLAVAPSLPCRFLALLSAQSGFFVNKSLKKRQAGYGRPYGFDIQMIIT